MREGGIRDESEVNVVDPHNGLDLFRRKIELRPVLEIGVVVEIEIEMEL